MTEEEWENCESAPAMLEALFRTQPDYFSQQSEALHRFLIACCWEHGHLIPQEGLRAGLRGAECWIDGKISDDELDRLNYHAETEAFKIDYAKTDSELAALENLISNIDELHGRSFEASRALLLKAAYFAEAAMIYPRFKGGPWVKSLFTSQFLKADTLRKHLNPSFPKSI